MNKVATLLLFFMISFGFSQDEEEIIETTEIEMDSISEDRVLIEEVEAAAENSNTYEEINYQKHDVYQYSGEKNTDYQQKRKYNEDLNKKYDGKEFQYGEEKIEEPKKDKQRDVPRPNKNTLSGFKSVVEFLATIFPYLLGVLVIFIIFKSVVGSDAEFWKFGKKSNNTQNEKLIYEEHEDINESDFEKLIQKALKNGDYRLATRFYYLLGLQKLSEKELIKYHKDKTNTEYQFELQNENLRTKFSYVSYIYSYVWYGEFPVDEQKFDTIKTKFQNFISAI